MIRRPPLSKGPLPAILGLLLAAACGGEGGGGGDVDRSPAPLADHECSACGMTVRDQPSPRGELVHRDGERAWFCSIADLVTYLEAPSPHGHPIAIYVEVMPDDASPDDLSREPLELRPVEEVSFVYGGLERPVMGEPVLTFGSREAAARAASRLHAHVTDFEGLRRALATGD